MSPAEIQDAILDVLREYGKEATSQKIAGLLRHRQIDLPARRIGGNLGALAKRGKVKARWYATFAVTTYQCSTGND